MRTEKFTSKLQTDGFHKELSDLINRHGIDSDLDAPDYVLSFHIIDHLANLHSLGRLKIQHVELNDLG